MSQEVAIGALIALAGLIVLFLIFRGRHTKVEGDEYADPPVEEDPRVKPLDTGGGTKPTLPPEPPGGP